MTATTAVATDNPNMRGSRLHRIVRRFAPSVASLTFNPVFKLAVNVLDAPLKGIFPDFRRLPPAHLRARVGVGDQLVRNQLQFFYSAHFWMYAFQEGWANLNSNIVDLGCGVGRYAGHLRDFNIMGKRYEGHYTGVDVDDEALKWCVKNFDGRFNWRRSTDPTTTYARQDEGQRAYTLPLPASTQDFVFSTSLFTHLLGPELRQYIGESHRVLKRGGVMAHSVFCLDYPPPTYGTRHTFKHKIGMAHCESEKNPEAAVAYTAAELIGLAERAGFKDVRIIHGPGVVQPMLFGRA